jgi:hypothetical protein
MIKNHDLDADRLAANVTAPAFTIQILRKVDPTDSGYVSPENAVVATSALSRAS